MVTPTCRSCGQPIQWATTTTGKRMPVDRRPHPDGNVLLRPRTAGPGLEAVVLGPLERLAQERVHQLHQSHFATCPQADQHRRSPT